MPARYHPLFDGVWNEEKFTGAPFEEVGFFIYLFGNARQRPSGIYRVTDQQMASDIRLPLAKVRRFAEDLDRRRAIVRDRDWLFVVGYFGRQPKHENLLNGVAADIANCTSDRILKAFGAKYSRFQKWSTERLATLAQRGLDFDRSGTTHRTEQSSTPEPTQKPPSSVAEIADRVLDKMRRAERGE